VVAVLDAPARDDLVAAPGADGELERVDAVTDLNLIEQPLRVLCERSRVVEVEGNVVEKTLGDYLLDAL
jgi:hypothetical protein